MKHLIQDIQYKLDEASQKDYEDALLSLSASKKKEDLARAKSFKQTYGDVPHGRVEGYGIVKYDWWKKHGQGMKYTPVNHKLDESVDRTGAIQMTVPLFIRCLEWAKEECKNDVEIHQFAEKVIAKGGLLDTDDYQSFLVK